MHFTNCAALNAILLTTLIENLRLCSSAEAGIVLNLFLNFEPRVLINNKCNELTIGLSNDRQQKCAIIISQSCKSGLNFCAEFGPKFDESYGPNSGSHTTEFTNTQTYFYFQVARKFDFAKVTTNFTKK